MQRKEEAYLIDILNAANTVVRFKDRTEKADFLENELMQSGILHQLIIIGEAVKRLSKEFKRILLE